MGSIKNIFASLFLSFGTFLFFMDLLNVAHLSAD